MVTVNHLQAAHSPGALKLPIACRTSTPPHRQIWGSVVSNANRHTMLSFPPEPPQLSVVVIQAQQANSSRGAWTGEQTFTATQHSSFSNIFVVPAEVESGRL